MAVAKKRFLIDLCLQVVFYDEAVQEINGVKTVFLK